MFVCIYVKFTLCKGNDWLCIKECTWKKYRMSIWYGINEGKVGAKIVILKLNKKKASCQFVLLIYKRDNFLLMKYSSLEMVKKQNQ